ncbi:MAG: V-type ATP synthase subunit I [Firmicutes bacterium]|nr:V-type ATP synthase subunit I [Bacillota bacterium]
MSIIKMQRIAVIGLDTDKEKLVSSLMDFGAVQLTDQTGKFEESLWKDWTVQDENQEAVTLLEGKMSRAESAFAVIEKYDARRKPLFKTRRVVSKADIISAGNHLEDEEKKVQMVSDFSHRLHSITDELNKLESDRISLLPWQTYRIPLTVKETKTCRIHKGVIPMTADVNMLAQQLEQEVEGLVFRLISSDKDMHYVAVIVMEDLEEQALTLLKQEGFSEIVFSGITGTTAENLDRIEKEKERLEGERSEVEAELTAVASSNIKEDIETYYDILAIKADQERIKTKLLKTKRTFMIEGWIPTKCVEGAKDILEASGCYYVFRDPSEEEEVPVILDNRNVFTPFEAVTEMYSLPDYRGFDPTNIFAIFYAIFFGMMLSDAGYGILMAVACFVALKKYPLEGTIYKMVKMFFYCGISTTFWGAMFGGWFGDIIQVASRTFTGHEVSLDPIWFNPIEDPMTLLYFSLALGIIHLFVGMGIKAYMQIKDGKWFDAVCDEGFWYMTILGLLGWLGGGSVSAALVTIGKWTAIIGMLGLLLTGGRHNKGFGKITGGLSNLYNITSYLSDILSYARILALGLATGVIAQVVNTMGAMAGGGVKGAIFLTLVFIVGHALNLAINVLGAFIHTSRLQYIEFFGKFYEDGGEPFDPFRKKTRYIKISQDE